MSLYAPLPPGPYEVVLADPPWSYTGAPDKWGAAAKFYNTLSVDDLAKLPVRDVMASCSVLFLWATCPKLDSAIDLIRRWDLHYRGVAFVWVKTARDGRPIGAQGVRPSITKPLTEMVLAASTVQKGRPLPLASESICQTVFAPRTDHSAKPVAVQDSIEMMYPDFRKIELFARSRREGWDAWGDEIGESDV